MRHLRPASRPGAMIGRSDHGLGPDAENEAAGIRSLFSGAVFDRVYSSPLKRAAETARLISGAEPEIVEALSEIDLGAWEGLTSSEARELWPEIHKARGLDMAGISPPFGESVRDLAARVWPAWDEIASGPGRNVLVVAHQCVNRVILARAKGLDLAEALKLDQPYGALTIISARA